MSERMPGNRHDGKSRKLNHRRSVGEQLGEPLLHNLGAGRRLLRVVERAGVAQALVGAVVEQRIGQQHFERSARTAGTPLEFKPRVVGPREGRRGGGRGVAEHGLERRCRNIG